MNIPSLFALITEQCKKLKPLTWNNRRNKCTSYLQTRRERKCSFLVTRPLPEAPWKQEYPLPLASLDRLLPRFRKTSLKSARRATSTVSIQPMTRSPWKWAQVPPSPAWEPWWPWNTWGSMWRQTPWWPLLTLESKGAWSSSMQMILLCFQARMSRTTVFTRGFPGCLCWSRPMSRRWRTWPSPPLIYQRNWHFQWS